MGFIQTARLYAERCPTADARGGEGQGEDSPMPEVRRAHDRGLPPGSPAPQRSDSAVAPDTRRSRLACVCVAGYSRHRTSWSLVDGILCVKTPSARTPHLTERQRNRPRASVVPGVVLCPQANDSPSTAPARPTARLRRSTALEHLRGSALGFRNLTNYIARLLLETGGFRPRLHPGS